MYNEKIEQLIDIAVVDGEISENERQVLFKKAEEAGIDLDEFEMVLDARLIDSIVKKEMKKNTLKMCSSIVLSVAYFISPIDIVPDFIPAVGYIDDVGVLVLGIAYAINRFLLGKNGGEKLIEKTKTKLKKERKKIQT